MTKTIHHSVLDEDVTVGALVNTFVIYVTFMYYQVYKLKSAVF